MDAQEILKAASEKLGGIRKLARALGVKHNSLYGWKKVPAERVLELERISGISRHKLRPDLYPEP